MKQPRTALVAAALALGVLLVGCAADSVLVFPAPPPVYVVLQERPAPFQPAPTTPEEDCPPPSRVLFSNQTRDYVFEFWLLPMGHDANGNPLGRSWKVFPWDRGEERREVVLCLAPGGTEPVIHTVRYRSSWYAGPRFGSQPGPQGTVPIPLLNLERAEYFGSRVLFTVGRGGFDP